MEYKAAMPPFKNTHPSHPGEKGKLSCWIHPELPDCSLGNSLSGDNLARSPRGKQEVKGLQARDSFLGIKMIAED
jgi:hypothetical protein